MLRKFLVSLPLMLLAVAGGSGFAYYLIATKPPPVRKEDPARAIRVEVFRVAPETVRETFVGFGTARPDEGVTLSAQVGGKIVEVARGLEDGSAIKAGQLLIRIEEDDYKHQLERTGNLIKSDEATLQQIEIERENLKTLLASAQQDVRIAKDEYTRISRLFENDAAAKREFDLVRSALLRVTREEDTLKSRLAQLGPKKAQTEASMAAHKAEVELARLSLGRCRIVAPFDGRVQRRVVEVGETVGPGTPLLMVLKMDRIEVPIELPATCASKTEIGNACTLAVESVPSLRWTGRLERLGPAADVQSRTITAYVVVDNTAQPKPLLPGLFVRAEVDGPLHADALVVPRGAIRSGSVFVAVDGVAREKPVTLACTLRDRAVVTRGIQSGDELILTNLASLRDAMPVEVAATTHGVADGRRMPTTTSQSVRAGR